MLFDVYGRFQLEIAREHGEWVAYRPGSGTRSRDADIVIPRALEADELAAYLDDLFHELGGPGQHVLLLS